VNFFFDNTLSPKLARSLDQLLQPEHSVRHLKQDFLPSVEDQQWMRELSQKAAGPNAVVTADVRIQRNPHGLAAWKESGHIIFFLNPAWTDLTSWQQAQKLTKVLPTLIAIATKALPDASFLVTANGKIAAVI
jgi:hypothetical protein